MQARALLMKSKIYRLLALIFAFTGLLIFVVLYLRNIEGHFFEALRQPVTVAIILVPFLPAIVLSILGQKAEKAFWALMQPAGSEKTEKK
ncbi:MAG: hypothetical protein HYS17_10060 [Micavibrio aeruginosavorus]|uniref:Uncharacterized protein n=1 Tax=Micavibrio aeruginosavorus TaxID=349221 RepID=A0A7T5R4M2_9BACT|nr:MAG: hypothetical protein HYS17_10060 [Micavibrio aeruginosavorus]